MQAVENGVEVNGQDLGIVEQLSAATVDCQSDNQRSEFDEVTRIGIIIVPIPKGWQPKGWSEIPGSTSPKMPYAAAALAARIANEQRIFRRENKLRKRLDSWAVVVYRKNRVVVLENLIGFDPTSADDMPYSVIKFEGGGREAESKVREMNRTLVNTGKWAFVVHFPESLAEINSFAERYAAEAAANIQRSKAANVQSSSRRPPKLVNGFPEQLETVHVSTATSNGVPAVVESASTGPAPSTNGNGHCNGIHKYGCSQSVTTPGAGTIGQPIGETRAASPATATPGRDSPCPASGWTTGFPATNSSNRLKPTACSRGESGTGGVWGKVESNYELRIMN